MEAKAMRRWVLAAVVLLMAAGGAVANTWQSDSGMVSGLGDVGYNSAPTVFQMDSVWYLIAGEGNGDFNGYNWTGSTWQSDSVIASGLGGALGYTAPTVFQMDGIWYLISGTSSTCVGYNWTGSTWQSDSSIVAGLGSYSYAYPDATVYQMDSTWYLVESPTSATYGYNWTGSTWQSDSSILVGLGGTSPDTIFHANGIWYLINGYMESEADGAYEGYNWTGSTWQSDSGIVSGLTATDTQPYPCAFCLSSTWQIISGTAAGTFDGYEGEVEIGTPAPTNLTNIKGKFWVNHTWDAGSGSAETDSYNVSINGTWHNGTTNTFYNNTLTIYGDWSNITVYAYNNTYGLSDNHVSEDVQLPYPIPATPSGAGSTWDYYWVNHTWTEGSSYGIWCGDTDSYNVSINGTWHNSTTDTYYNNTGLSPHGWSNASIYAFNNTAGINETYIYQNVQMANRAITITNTSDWSGCAGGMDVYVDYDATDPDGDTPTFSCNRTDLFTDFSTSLGTGNLTTVEGVYIVDFGVSDGWGSTDNYTMTISVHETADPTSLANTTGKFWVNHTWNAGVGDVTDSYNVSVNETWHNSTTNTYYNNTLTTYGDWSNITVYAYNNTCGLSGECVSEDVQLPLPIPATPSDAGSTWGYYWVNHTWTEGSSYGIWCGATDSYNVYINGIWHNGTTNTYYNNTELSPYEWSNASIYAFNNTAGINETYINQNVQILECDHTVCEFIETFDSCADGDLNGQCGWTRYSCPPLHVGYIQAYIVGYAGNEHDKYVVQGPRQWVSGAWEGACTLWNKTLPTPQCGTGDDMIYIDYYYAEPDGGDYEVAVGFKNGEYVAAVGFNDHVRTSIVYEADVWCADGETITNFARNPGDWIHVEFTFDLSTDVITEITFTNLNTNATTTLSGGDIPAPPLGYAIDYFDEVWMFITSTDDPFIVDNIRIGGTPPTYIYLKDAHGNFVNNCEIAVYSETLNEYIQKWTLTSDGILQVVGSVGTEFIIMARTFDGVFIEHITIKSGYPTQTITIPLHYNVNIHPEDEYGTPLTGVFAGLAEYTFINPLAFWGFSMSGRQYVPVTNCSGFAMCDIYAEKGGYQVFEITGLNWTSKSAMVKDYRHTVVLEAE